MLKELVLILILELLDNDEKDLISLMTCNKLEVKERKSKIVNILQNVKEPDGELVLFCNYF